MEEEKTRPAFVQIYMRLAEMMAERSTCRRLSVGCAITTPDFRQVLAVGYNGGAAGLKNDCDRVGEDAVGNCGCFPSGTRVEASQIQRAYHRRYEGPLVRVIADDEEFSATPNHPVLTLHRGWVPLNLLTEGDDLLCARRAEAVSPGVPNYENDVAIEEIFQAILVAGSSNVRCAGARHHFHGDGILEEDVDVVSANRSLTPRVEAGRLHFISEPVLPTALEVQSAFAGHRAFVEGRFAVGSAADASFWRAPVQDSRFSEPFTNRHSAYAKTLGDLVGGFAGIVPRNNLVYRQGEHSLPFMTAEILGDAAKYTRLTQAALNGRVGDAASGGDLEHCLSGLVTTRKVRRIEFYSWSGHVYNLQTASGWYKLAQGIIVKNCVHAEQNAVINCAAPRSQEKIVFCTHLPCVMCAKFLINLGGVKAVFYRNDYRVKDSLGWFRDANIDAGHLTPTSTASQAFFEARMALSNFGWKGANHEEV